MKCPHCEYKHGYEWVKEANEKIEGDKGDFFSLPIKMEREAPWEPKEEEQIYGCPNCGILFMNVN